MPQMLFLFFFSLILLAGCDVITPNDPYFLNGSLWSLNQISAPLAWGAYGTGIIDPDPEVPPTVCIIDSGVSYTHDDLRANFLNTEVGPEPGKGFFIPNGTSSTFTDDDGHGTHITGIIAATGNNSIGTVGVSWRQKLIACRNLNAAGEGKFSVSIDCLLWCRDQGAKIISGSWGKEQGKSPYPTALYQTLATLDRAGILMVFSAGNSGVDIDFNTDDPTASLWVPASFNISNMIVVAATTPDDSLWIEGSKIGSNFGSVSVDIAAPGQNILSTAPNNTYQVLNGTSQATAFVSGAAALMWSTFPYLNTTQVRDYLLGSVDIVPQLAGKVVSGGRLNVSRAMEQAAKFPAPLRPVALIQVLDNPSSSPLFDSGFCRSVRLSLSTFLYTNKIALLPNVTEQAEYDNLVYCVQDGFNMVVSVTLFSQANADKVVAAVRLNADRFVRTQALPCQTNVMLVAGKQALSLSCNQTIINPATDFNTPYLCSGCNK